MSVSDLPNPAELLPDSYNNIGSPSLPSYPSSHSLLISLCPRDEIEVRSPVAGANMDATDYGEYTEEDYNQYSTPSSPSLIVGEEESEQLDEAPTPISGSVIPFPTGVEQVLVQSGSRFIAEVLSHREQAVL